MFRIVDNAAKFIADKNCNNIQYLYPKITCEVIVKFHSIGHRQRYLKYIIK